jgi:hypothetical protein
VAPEVDAPPAPRKKRGPPPEKRLLAQRLLEEHQLEPFAKVVGIAAGQRRRSDEPRRRCAWS